MRMNKKVISLLIVAGCAIAVVWLNHAGLAARRQGRTYRLGSERFPVHLVQTNAEVDAIWKEKQVHGRVVVHFSIL